MQPNSTTKKCIPSELMKVYEKASEAIAPIKPADENSKAGKNFLFTADETRAGNKLPPYFLVYFLLVDLLGFRDLGKSEKIAWSIPIDFNGHAFLIDYRKFGIGVFTQNPKQKENDARQIVNRIHKAVKVAQPFFDWVAEEAIAGSKLNVVNNSSELLNRYIYLRDAYQLKAEEASKKDKELFRNKDGIKDEAMDKFLFMINPIRKEASWLGISAVEAFFSWTEHVLIHIAILTCQIKTAEEVTALAEADWATKFKRVLDIADPSTKNFFDRLLILRRELRNYVAHGAFGKQGEAFSFHSGTGAVPVLLPHKQGERKFRLGPGLTFDPISAINLIEEFREFLWLGSRKPAEMYIQQSGLPLLLTLAADGSYTKAMDSIEAMELFLDNLAWRFDVGANMDW